MTSELTQAYGWQDRLDRGHSALSSAVDGDDDSRAAMMRDLHLLYGRSADYAPEQVTVPEP